MSRYMVQATWDDVPHLNEKEKAELRAAYPPYQLDARTKGIPQLGSGATYPVPESEIVIAPFDIPAYFPRGYAVDVGWNRTAALWGAHDRETDTLFLYSEHYRGHAEPPVHAAAIRSRGAWMNGVIDPAARGRGQKDGERLLQNYVDQGLKVTPAVNAVEAGIFQVYTRLATSRLKVFSTLQNWLGEFRIYRRDEHGAIVKENDHLMDCTRYLVISGLHVFGVDPRYLQKMGLKTGGVISEYDPLG
jgi:hypothetical protein